MLARGYGLDRDVVTSPRPAGKESLPYPRALRISRSTPVYGRPPRRVGGGQLEFIRTTSTTAATARTARPILTHDQGAFPETFPVTPFTRKR